MKYNLPVEVFTPEMILEINKKIATFLGYTYYPNVVGLDREPGWKLKEGYTLNLKQIPIKPFPGYLCRNHNQLSFHCSLPRQSMFMKKIELSGYDTLVKFNYLESTYYVRIDKCEEIDGKINTTEIVSVSSSTKKDAKYLACVELLKHLGL